MSGNGRVKKVSEEIANLEARLIVFCLLFAGILLALSQGWLSSEQFMAMLATDGLIYKVLEKKEE